MIIARLYGGLGNQMFIYAAAKALALRTNQILVLDIQSGFSKDFTYRRTYQLGYFQLKTEFATKFQSFMYPCGLFLQRISRKLGYNILYPTTKMIHETSQNKLNTNIFQKGLKNVYMEGFWQSELYFKDVTNVIRTDFQFKDFRLPISKEEKKAILQAGKRSVAIGIRRYQECSDPTIMNPLGKEYYQKAITLIREKVKDPIFFIFSQDNEWAHNNIEKNNDTVFISSKSGDDGAIDDLQLMSTCSNFIISNSSFYWWGAWLSTNPNKTVISSKAFFDANSCLPDWIVI